MTERLSRQDRKSQTRARLLDAAAEVFASRGFESATIDEVAAAAGYTKGAVYSNFASKTDLLIALLERRIESQSAQYSPQFEGRNLEAVARGMEPSDRMADAERQFLVLAMEFWLHAMRDDRTKHLVAEQYERAREIVAGWLVAAGYDAAGPGSSDLTAREVAVVIEALATGVKLQAALDPENVNIGIVKKVLLKLLGIPAPSA
jgi:AcrR family transcriptional regulator